MRQSLKLKHIAVHHQDVADITEVDTQYLDFFQIQTFKVQTLLNLLQMEESQKLPFLFSC